MIHYPKRQRKFKNNVCKTFSHIDEDGNKVYKDKVKYDTLDEAIEVCKHVNSQPQTIHKIVSYKCTVCHKYHTGRNGKLVKRK